MGASVSFALTSQLFWNIPWNGGMVKPVTLRFPRGTVLTLRYPAACGGASGTEASSPAAPPAPDRQGWALCRRTFEEGT